MARLFARSLISVALCGLAGCPSSNEDDDGGSIGDGDGGSVGDGDGSGGGDATGGGSNPGDGGPAGGSGDGNPGDDSTGGDPGPPPPGVACDQSFEHEGYTGCLTEVGGLEIKFFPLPECTPVQRLVVFFHGDTGVDWFENWGFRPEILDWAYPQDMLVLGVKSPAAYPGDTEPSYGAAQPADADVVTQSIEYFRDQYGVTADQTLYWGVSGGSWFFTSSFIAVAGARMPGIFVANCGGSGGSFGWAWDPATDTASRELDALLLNYGDQDFLAPNAAASYQEFLGMGFATEQIVYPGATHCDHPISEPTIDFWADHLP